ncbi:TetR family transcriptional regulator [Paenibacillus timonensis]|uniref:TetR family transcriptional regulator n=2 Tax=Paenibacillus TaxID=44249 RepID=A0A9X1XVN6_9BACL|nr:MULTISPECIES: TetR/AcrR family transcriptional regulator [Paenibacillus]MCH1638655.1 TetR family transcriptional regulator [Paenibacillus timonensis]MCK8485818.1 TetR family transcriptional regulator [Paenibacillus mellifer]
MPKQVDHEQRKQVIAEATWRVILEQGMEGATVRNIARAAGLSPGALRHDFSSQEELLLYAMNLVKERAAGRILDISALDLPPKEKVLRILLEVVPTREETRAEMEVWMAFTAYFRHKPKGFDARHDGLYDLMQRLIASMDQHGLLQAGADRELETERLYALIDGIALHALLDPVRLDPKKIRRILTAHLDSFSNAAADA